MAALVVIDYYSLEGMTGSTDFRESSFVRCGLGEKESTTEPDGQVENDTAVEVPARRRSSVGQLLRQAVAAFSFRVTLRYGGHF